MKSLDVLSLMGLFVVLSLLAVLLVYASNIFIDESVMHKKEVYETADDKLSESISFLNDLVNSRDRILTEYKSKNDSIKDILSGVVEGPKVSVVSAINKIRGFVGDVSDSASLSELINMADSNIRARQRNIASKLHPERDKAWLEFQRALLNHNANHSLGKKAHGPEFGNEPLERETLVETKIFCSQKEACLKPPGNVSNPTAHRTNCDQKVEKTTFFLFKRKVDCKGYTWTCDDPTIPDVCPRRISHVSD